MARGRPVQSPIRQNIVELLYFLKKGYGYDVYKVYKSIFPAVTMRSIYYHLKKGVALGEFKVDKIAGIANNFALQKAAHSSCAGSAELLARYEGIRGVLCVDSGADLPVVLKNIHPAGAKAKDRVTGRCPSSAVRTRARRIEINLPPIGCPGDIVR